MDMALTTAVMSAEPLTDALIAELLPLLRAHYLEIAHFRDLPLDPDWMAYFRIQSNGGFKIFTARLPDGELVGYSAWFVSVSLHYKSAIFANEDVLYVDPRYRGAGTGERLILHAREGLKKLGVSIMFHHCKHVARLNLGPWLARRLDCEQVDDIWAYRLGYPEGT